MRLPLKKAFCSPARPGPPTHPFLDPSLQDEYKNDPSVGSVIAADFYHAPTLLPLPDEDIVKKVGGQRGCLGLAQSSHEHSRQRAQQGASGGTASCCARCTCCMACTHLLPRMCCVHTCARICTRLQVHANVAKCEPAFREAKVGAAVAWTDSVLEQALSLTRPVLHWASWALRAHCNTLHISLPADAGG